jgi:hypothetical protein
VAQESHGCGASVEGAAMSGRVDPFGESADNAKPCGTQVAGKLKRIAHAGPRRVAAANNGKRGHLQQARVAFNEQAVRGRWDLIEKFGKAIVAACEDEIVRGLEPFMIHTSSLKKTAPESAVFI